MNYIDRNISVRNHTSLHWFYTKKRLLYRSTNKIIGLHNDRIIREHISFTNNGFSKNTFFNSKLVYNNFSLSRSDKINNNIYPEDRCTLKSSANFFRFISFFLAVNSTYSKNITFNIFPKKYFKRMILKYKKKQQVFSGYNTFNRFHKFSSLIKSNLEFNQKLRKPWIRFKINKRFINSLKPIVKKKRKDWLVKRTHRIFVSRNYGWVKLVKKKHRLNDILKRGSKHRFWILKYWSIKNSLNIIRFTKKFIKFLSKFNLLKNNFNFNYARNILIYLAYWKLFCKRLNKTMSNYGVGKYRYDRVVRKKLLKIRRLGGDLIRYRGYNHFFFALRKLRKIRIFFKKIKMLYLKNFTNKLNYFFNKLVLDVFFDYNNKKVMLGSDENKLIWNDYIFHRLLEKKNAYKNIYIKYSLFTSFFKKYPIIPIHGNNENLLKFSLLNTFLNQNVFNKKITLYISLYNRNYNFIYKKLQAACKTILYKHITIQKRVLMNLFYNRWYISHLWKNEPRKPKKFFRVKDDKIFQRNKFIYINFNRNYKLRLFSYKEITYNYVLNEHNIVNNSITITHRNAFFYNFFRNLKKYKKNRGRATNILVKMRRYARIVNAILSGWSGFNRDDEYLFTNNKDDIEYDYYLSFSNQKKIENTPTKGRLIYDNDRNMFYNALNPETIQLFFSDLEVIKRERIASRYYNKEVDIKLEIIGREKRRNWLIRLIKKDKKPPYGFERLLARVKAEEEIKVLQVLAIRKKKKWVKNRKRTIRVNEKRKLANPLYVPKEKERKEFRFTLHPNDRASLHKGGIIKNKDWDRIYRAVNVTRELVIKVPKTEEEILLKEQKKIEKALKKKESILEFLRFQKMKENQKKEKKKKKKAKKKKFVSPENTDAAVPINFVYVKSEKNEKSDNETNK